MMLQRPAVRGAQTGKGEWICSRCVVQGRRVTIINNQRRWLGRNYVKNIAQAEEAWQNRLRDIQDGTKKSIVDVLEERGLLNQTVGTRDELKKLLDTRRVGVYCGVDPTAPSLHVGHLIPFMALTWMYVYGYSVTFLLGGATGRIGDPEGRLSARDPLSRTERNANAALMHTQIKRFGELMQRYVERRGWVREWSWRRALINNVDWHSRLMWFEMLTIMGQHVRIGPMLGRDSVKNRLEQGDGMSFAEFSYPLMQAWDWWQLFQNGTQVQIGGADQYGNILQGAEAVKSAAKNNDAYMAKVSRLFKTTQERSKEEPTEWPLGFTTPLLTASSGEKFGKSAGNAVWISADMTSVFELYQFWLRTSDADVEKYLKMFTFLPIPEIESLIEEHRKDESKREAQHKLAKEFVELIHGLKASEDAEKQHRTLFSKDMTLEQIVEATKEKQPPAQEQVESHPTMEKNSQPQNIEKYGMAKAMLPRSAVIEQSMARVLWSAGFAKSRSEGQRLINNKGAYIAGRRGADDTRRDEDSLVYTAITDPRYVWWKRFLVDEKLLILRTGKWRIKIIDIVPDDEFIAKGLVCPGFNDSETTDGDEGPKEYVPQGPKRGKHHIDVEEVSGDDGWEDVSDVHYNEAQSKKAQISLDAGGSITDKKHEARLQADKWLRKSLRKSAARVKAQNS